MPRTYTNKGDLRRSEHITALFTKEEKERVMQAALAVSKPASVFIHEIVLERVGRAA